jgi:hypothetical protein
VVYEPIVKGEQCRSQNLAVFPGSTSVDRGRIWISTSANEYKSHEMFLEGGCCSTYSEGHYKLAASRIGIPGRCLTTTARSIYLTCSSSS